MMCKVFEKKKRKENIMNYYLYKWLEYRDIKSHKRLMDSVFIALGVSKTIPELSYELNAEEFDIISAIGDLESINKVALDSWRPFYRPDGCVAFIAVYGCIKTPIARQSITPD